MNPEIARKYVSNNTQGNGEDEVHRDGHSFRPATDDLPPVRGGDSAAAH